MTLTPKQEAFATSYMETGNASEAYRRAYNAVNMTEKSINENASKLLRHAKIAPRLSELQKQAQERHNVTIDSLTAELEEARAIAKSERQAAAAVSATMGKAKIHGLIVDKGEVTGKDGAPLVPVLNVQIGRDKP